MNTILKNNIGIFENLTDEENIKLSTVFKHQKYKKGDFIISENDMVQDVYFIHLGLVKLSHFDSNAKEFILSFAFENWWETDFSAFYNKTKATLMLQCLEDTEVYSLSYDSYLSILSKYHLANYFLEKSIKGHIASQKRILSLLKSTPKEKYEQFLKLYPTLANRIPKSVIAIYLGVSRETLSRLYKRKNL
ncbi:Crp/Fnr family transcriptional regulator [Flavobacterium sp. J27]|uniref:Crp/Fnr family transcriptional regulator n=1 Tax=Flavobacterium sp. J27 TaxID=2060419 RepID=UPI00103055FD|nr:Crp/Fnr family transcriptional regulator [Flavobacterium sp. J27]